MNNNYTDYLCHYGVIGMKWGVRRYQNYDGSYTKKGLERYKNSETNYNNAKGQYKAVKAAVKETKRNGYAVVNGNKVAVMPSVKKEAKQELKSAKKQLKSDYKQLKQDNKADKGKALYKSGHLISTESNAGFLRGLGIIAVSAIGESYANSKQAAFVTKHGDIPVSRVIDAVGTAALIGNIAYTENRKNNLRAYYAH